MEHAYKKPSTVESTASRPPQQAEIICLEKGAIVFHCGVVHNVSVRTRLRDLEKNLCCQGGKQTQTRLQNEKVAFLLIRIYAPLLRW
jgi:hypothetical protein